MGSPYWEGGDDYLISTFGGNDDITLYVSGSVKLDAGDGDDYVRLKGSGDAVVYGGLGNDTVMHTTDDLFPSAVAMYGGEGDDELHGLYGVEDHLYGGAGNDRMSVQGGNIARGGIGNDTYFVADEGDSTVIEYAGEGIDMVVTTKMAYTLTANVENLRATSIGNGGVFYGNGLANQMFGSKYDEAIYGGAGHDSLDGGSGDDKLYGDSGNDTLIGGNGADQLYGGTGNDLLDGGSSVDTMSGGAGNDVYIADRPDVVIEAANEGVDTVKVIGGVAFTLSANVENLELAADYAQNGFGNDLANTITGNAYANVIEGGKGGDTVYAGAGDDRVNGDDQNDVLFGNSGNDWMSGDAGADSVYGGEGMDMMYGGDANDYMMGQDGADFMDGGLDSDTLSGGNGDDVMNGGSGFDSVSGDAGNDLIRGGSMSDQIDGGAGNDRLYGDGGGDKLTGGTGSDLFIFTALSDSFVMTGVDTIADFTVGVDRIDLSAIDANAGLAGNQVFDWLGMSQPDSNGSGRLWGQHVDATNTTAEHVTVYADVNGDGTADFSLNVMNVAVLNASDFLL
ncbi:hypothetical protein ABAC460_09035 [Asticcacaulis sp. AC460]|nr:hypothetical protein ABAC460_09035 [Asticcacaulis sp. AC460]